MEGFRSAFIDSVFSFFAVIVLVNREVKVEFKLYESVLYNHLVLVALLYSRASSSCHVVKLPVSPLMFLPPFSGLFYIRNLWISCKVSPLFDGNVIRTNGHFCDEFRMGRCDFPVDCGNSIEVHNGTGPSPPPPPSERLGYC